MARSSFRHFFSPDALKDISPEHLLSLLLPYGDYVASRGLVLPETASEWEPDLDRFSAILNLADNETPMRLYEALYFIHEMASADGMSALIDAFGLQRLQLCNLAGYTIADVTVRAWLTDEDLLKRKHAEMRITRRRAYDYFFTDRPTTHAALAEDSPQFEALKRALDEDFKHGKDDTGCEIFPFQRDDGLWLMIRHGDALKRDLQVKNGKQAIIVYRPMKYDVAVLNPTHREVRINAQPRRRVSRYRGLLGSHLFGDVEFFSRTDKYTLEPLRTRGAKSLLCPEVKEIERIRLIAIDYLWGGPEGEIETRAASDVFVAYSRRDIAMPKHVRITKATFDVKFKGVRKSRSITLNIPNRVGLTQDGDAPLIEGWLFKRGFMRPSTAISSTRMPGFWHALARVQALAATEGEWRQHMKFEYDWVKHLLSPCESYAATVKNAAGVELRVVEVDHEQFVGVNDADGLSIPLSEEDIQLYEIDQAAVSTGLCKAFRFHEQFQPGCGIARTVKVGMYQPYAGFQFRAFLCFAGDANTLRQAAEALITRHPKGLVLLAPTADFFDDTTEQLVAASKSCFMSLEDAIEFMEDGSMAMTEEAEAAVEAFRSACLPLEGSKDTAGMVFFPTPPNARWGDVHITFSDNHTVSVKVRANTRMCSYADMGMADRKAHRPNKQWELLRAFAANHGVLTWSSKEARRENKKRKQLLNKALHRFFRIEGAAITFEEGEGYKAHFHIGE